MRLFSMKQYRCMIIEDQIENLQILSVSCMIYVNKENRQTLLFAV